MTERRRPCRRAHREYEAMDRGIRIDRISGGLQFRTAGQRALRPREGPKPVRARAQLKR